MSGLEDDVAMRIGESGVTRKLRLVAFEMGTWGREVFGCSRERTVGEVVRDVNQHIHASHWLACVSTSGSAVVVNNT